MLAPMNPLFGKLFEGPIDIVGDIHGELDALHQLLHQLGYDQDGRHPSRRLIFIGDLCDRGHDSPGTVDFIRGLVATGAAQCLLGNHELNLLRGVPKDGNGWFFNQSHDQASGRYLESAALAKEDRNGFVEFFSTLPLVLERADLRLVHAAWDDAAISLLRDCDGNTLDIYRAYAARAADIVKESGLGTRAARELEPHGANLRDQTIAPPLLTYVGKLDALYQMANPVRILTSGPEALATRPFYAAGKWRMLDRVRWWQRYHHETPVLVGHYWRWPDSGARHTLTRGERDLFDGAPIHHWHGARRNVFCLDFAVGARHKERAQGRRTGFTTRLGAVRWPERELVLEDGTRRQLA